MMGIGMRKFISVLVVGIVASAGALVAEASGSQIYKYRKKDGTVVYTDKLSDLPRSARAKYAKREAEEQKARARLEASLGKAEVARRESEAKRKAELARQIEQADAMRRRQELQALLARLNERDAKEAEREQRWRKRLADAKAEVERLYKEFQQTREAYDNLAVRIDYTLFPGQNKEKFKLRDRLEKLEKELDAALTELNDTIPTEARRAGVPPGWLR